jgi:hypothetical protein
VNTILGYLGDPTIFSQIPSAGSCSERRAFEQDKDNVLETEVSRNGMSVTDVS